MAAISRLRRSRFAGEFPNKDRNEVAARSDILSLIKSAVLGRSSGTSESNRGVDGRSKRTPTCAGDDDCCSFQSRDVEEYPRDLGLAGVLSCKFVV